MSYNLPKRSPSSTNSTKRQFDDDQTFLPPALSSFSLALLTNTGKTTISTTDELFKNNNSFKTKLINHFTELEELKLPKESNYKRIRKMGKTLGPPKRANDNNNNNNSNINTDEIHEEEIIINEDAIKKRVDERKNLDSPFEYKERTPLVELPINEFRKPKLPPKSPLKPTSSSSSNRTIIINDKQYEKLGIIGRGGSSKVYQVRLLQNNKEYALKKVSLDQFEDVNGFKGEIDLLIKLRNSSRVVKLIDHAITDSSIYLIMEKGELDLAQVIQAKLNTNNELDLNFVKYHTIEMLNCIKAVHDAGIVHSDLKPANFLFVKGILKIIDFGIANAVPDHTVNVYRDSQIGTPNYMAPEALITKGTTWKVGKPSDVWSCGCILYQLIYGKPPYASYNGQQRIMAIMNPQIKIQYPNQGLGGTKVPISAIELLKNCLARDPNDRFTIEQCLTSDFLNPKIVNESVIRGIVHRSVNYGYTQRANVLPSEAYDQIVKDVLQQLDKLNI
ncbi:unnamed protein product [Candida verbasci]|uniref:Protein kinase domain-containing protein n=1 Tax=Candida verbasci TaxID=1227364 RepID=A0A9W4TRR3_9ASCO|nr:unnamed protein product [Candida verbasci]